MEIPIKIGLLLVPCVAFFYFQYATSWTEFHHHHDVAVFGLVGISRHSRDLYEL